MKNLKFKRKETKKQQSSGITLIALVITIIVLLILAGISISMLSGDNSILSRAIDAKTNTDNAQIKERVRLAYNSAWTRDLTNGNGDLTKPTLDEEINKEFGNSGKVIVDKNEWVILVEGKEMERVPKTKEKNPAIFKNSFMGLISGKTGGPNGIKAILESNTKPDITDTANVVNVATESSEPIYMWFESSSGTLYWWSNDKTPSLPEMTGSMFGGCGDVDITGIANWDASTVKNMAFLFAGSGITDCTPVTNWDTSNVTIIACLCAGGHVKDLTPFANWDVSKVEDFSNVFAVSEKIVNISAINNWNIVNGKNFRDMFIIPNHANERREEYPVFSKMFGLWSDRGSFYPMNLELNGGTINSGAKVIEVNNDSNKISEITGIEKEGYSLTWYTNSELTQQAEFPLDAYGDNVIHLYAKWE